MTTPIFNRENRLMVLKQQLQETIRQTVKRPWTKLWRIYRRPWYLILGEAGAGKTTFLDHTGLQFRWRSVSQRTLEGSHDVDWFVSDQAVFLELSSRLLREGWLPAFLRLLRKVRPFRPFNGIIMMLPATSLLLAESTTLAASADDIRRHIDLIQHYSWSRVPVYVVITKADMLPGFDAFFARLPPSRREQVLGATFAVQVKAPHKDTLDSFNEQYDALLKQLNRAVLPNTLMALHFPRVLALLKKALHEVLEKGLFYSNYFRRIYVRGFYWVAVPNAQTHYFIKDLCQQVILKEAHLGGIAQRFMGALNMLKRSLGVVVLGVTALFLLAWITGFSRGQLYVANIDSDFSHEQYLMKEWQLTPFATDTAQNTLRVLSRMVNLRAQQTQQWAWYLGFPFPVNVDHAVNQLYQQVLHQEYQRFVVYELAQGLKNALTTGQRQSIYDWLSAYLMFQSVDHLDSAHVSFMLQTYWQTLYPHQPAVVAEWQQWLQDLLAQPITPTPLDGGLVARARAALGDDPVPQQAYVALKAAAPAAEFFTVVGYQQWVANRESAAILKANQEKWVLGPSHQAVLTDEVLARDRAYVETEYWRDYAAYWQNALRSFNIVPPPTLTGVQTALAVLAKPNSSLMVLLQTLNDNTSVQALNNVNAGSIALSELQYFIPINQFTAEQAERWQGHFQTFSQYINTIANASDTRVSAYQAAVALSTTTVTSVSDWQQDLADVPEPLKTQFQAILNNGLSVIRDLSETYLRQQWNQQFGVLCQQHIMNQYPFAVLSDDDMPLSQFAQDFGASGVLVQFVTEKLLPLVDQHNSLSWQPKRVNQINVGLPEALLQNAYNIMSVHQAYFAPQQNAPSLVMQITPWVLSKNLADVTVHYNGLYYEYQNGPQVTQSLTWPSAHQSTVTMSLTDLDGNLLQLQYAGTWGLIRWLRSGVILPVNIAQKTQLYQALFSPQHFQATYQITLQLPQSLNDALAYNPIQCEV